VGMTGTKSALPQGFVFDHPGALLQQDVLSILLPSEVQLRLIMGGKQWLLLVAYQISAHAMPTPAIQNKEPCKYSFLASYTFDRQPNPKRKKACLQFTS